MIKIPRYTDAYAIFVYHFSFDIYTSVCRDYITLSGNDCSNLTGTDDINLSDIEIDHELVCRIFLSKLVEQLNISYDVLIHHRISLKTDLFNPTQFKMRLLSISLDSEYTPPDKWVSPPIKFVLYASDAALYNTFVNYLKMKNIQLKDFVGYTDLTGMIRRSSDNTPLHRINVNYDPIYETNK